MRISSKYAAKLVGNHVESFKLVVIEACGSVLTEQSLDVHRDLCMNSKFSVTLAALLKSAC
jgi:hypothetical protein